ncbi:MAG: cobalamin B12-binding domain-containing protein [Desulfobacteraceae bacterium]|nr:cobalamin B12-binding domain-containing protein [Desulfobacteraceae bacterium]
MSRLDILLVNPSNQKQMYGELGVSLAACEPPIWTALLAAFIRKKGYSVAIIDANANGWSQEYTADKIVEYNPLLVGISAIGANPSASSTPKMPAISWLLNNLYTKSSNIKTFLYGIHPSALPERTLKEEHVDFICRGECFYTVPKLLDALKCNDEKYKINGLWYRNGDQIISNGWGKLVEDIDELPLIAWDLLPMQLYLAHNWHCFKHLDKRQPYAVIYTSLGCPYNCTYCNISALYDGKPRIRFRSPQKVIEEIDLLVREYNVKNIKILDELFVLKESRVLEFCDLIIERGYDLNIWAYARVDTINEKLLKRLKQAGINWLCYGIESGSKVVRNGVHKGKFAQDAIMRAIEMTKKAGINIIGNYMFGLPDDDLATMRETLDLAKDLNCEYANFYSTMAYPGSLLYEKSIENGVEMPDNWLGFSQLNEETFPLPTKYISNVEVLRFRDQAFQEYFSNLQYLKMIEGKFGMKVVEHVNHMLMHKLDRKLLNQPETS